MPETIMMLISHRGNTDGPMIGHENTPAYIDHAIELGYYVEVDVWGNFGNLWLGHDKPEVRISSEFFRDRESNLFLHCKNLEAINLLQRDVEWPAFFFHHNDAYTITSNLFIWCYPGSPPPDKNGIVVLPETQMSLEAAVEHYKRLPLAGICSDYISSFTKA